jgi:hypothetical protein
MVTALKPAHALLAPSRRGLLLDAVVLAANLLAMGPLTGWLAGVLRRAAADDAAAMAALALLAAALLVLAPAGAVLKRWHYHQRRVAGPGALDGAGGCLFNPIFYFCLVAVLFAMVNAFLMQQAFGRRGPSGAVFGASMVAGIALIVAHTWLVYRYFTPPPQPPRSAFLRGPAAEALGDAMLFTNMLLFQAVWNMLSFAGIGPPSGVAEAMGRLLVFGFLALLLYFPPRMFYLAEDLAANRRIAWLTMVAANAPVIVRLLFGSSA